MRPGISHLLARAEAIGCELEVHGDRIKWRARNPLPEDLLIALRESKAELLTELRQERSAPPPPSDVVFDALVGHIRQARDWQDLCTIVTDAETAYVANKMSGDEVEHVARLATIQSRQLPKYAERETEG